MVHMEVDFSKMTKEDYELVINTRIRIDKTLRGLELLKLNLNTLDNHDEGVIQAKERVEELISKNHEYSETLKKFEL